MDRIIVMNASLIPVGKVTKNQEAPLATHTIQYPRLRNIEAFPIEYEGQQVICLRDPTHLAEHPVFVNPGVLFLLSLFDGQHSLADIQVEYTRHFGELPARDQLDNLIAQLDEHLLLDSDRFAQVRQQIEDAFRQSTVRNAAHAGTAYESDAEGLLRQLEGFYRASSGPGLEPASPNGRIKGVISPHIDFHRGGPCYAWAYRELASSLEADLFIIIGIGHFGSGHLFTMTPKDFSTPLGTMRTDREFVARVQAACPFDVLADEFLHKDEHSVEFQVVFLQSLLSDRQDAMIVPILCGSFHDMVQTGTLPSEHPQFQGFVDALRQTIEASGKRVCIIAGVDLAHVGKRFGDQEPLTDTWLGEIRDADLRLLQHVEHLDSEAFFRHICEDQDQRRICGYPAIYTLMTLADACEGHLLKYDQAVDTATQQTVTFASMVLR